MRVGCDKAPPLAALQISKARVLPSLTPTAATLRFEVLLGLGIRVTSSIPVGRTPSAFYYAEITLLWFQPTATQTAPHCECRTAPHAARFLGWYQESSERKTTKKKMQYAIK